MRSRCESQQAGIGIVYQEPSLCPNLSIAENIYLGNEVPGLIPGTVDRRATERRTAALLDRVHLSVPPATLVRRLSVAQRHLVQVARSLASELARPRVAAQPHAERAIIIMDEPTASLSDREVETLFAIIRKLKAERVTVLYISHKLDEIFEIADRVTVLRDGEFVTTLDLATTTKDEIVRNMVGRGVAGVERDEGRESRGTVLETRSLTRKGAFEHVSIRVKGGEVVALAGLVGSGRTEVARAIFGLDRCTSGEITFDGARRCFRSPAEAVTAGIGMVPEDRSLQGLVLDMTVSRNVSLPRVAIQIEDEDRVVGRLGLLRPQREASLASRFVDRLRIGLSRLTAPARSLSGGNQQKVVLSKWLSTRPKLLILDEPTRGIDVGAKAQIHALIRQLARDGVAVLMISSELPEVLTVSNTIYVMHEGRVTGRIEAAEATEEKVMALATQ